MELWPFEEVCTWRRLGVNERAPPDGRARAQGRGIETERRDSCLLCMCPSSDVRALEC